MSNFTYLPELSDINIFTCDKSYSIKGHKFALVKIEEWKDKILNAGELITPFNRCQLILIIRYIYNDVIENGDLNNIDILDMIEKLRNIKFFALLIIVLWNDLFSNMKGKVEKDLFLRIIRNVDMYENLLIRTDTINNLSKLDKESLKSIPPRFILTLVEVNKSVTSNKISLGNIVAKWSCVNQDNTEIIERVEKIIPGLFESLSSSVVDECISMYAIKGIFKKIIEVKQEEIRKQYTGSEETIRFQLDELFRKESTKWKWCKIMEDMQAQWKEYIRNSD